MAFAQAANPGNMNPIIIKDDSHNRDHDRSFGWGWIFALVIIFLALVFLWGRRDHGGASELKGMAEMMMPMIAANMQPRHPQYIEMPPARPYAGGHGCDDHKLWDIERDNLNAHATTQTKVAEEAGTTRTKMTEENWKLSDTMKDNRHSADMQYAELSKQSEVNTAKVIAEQKDSERRIMDKIAEDARRKLEQENMKLYTENAQLRHHHDQPVRRPMVYDCPDYRYAAG